MFLGGLLKGGISIKQPFDRHLAAWFEYNTFWGVRKRPYGLLVSWLLCVWHTVGSWNNNRPDPLAGVGFVVVPGFPHTTETLT